MFRLISRGKLTILLFHKVPTASHLLGMPEINLARFEAILKTTQQRFRILELEDALSKLDKNNLPENSACITFDDGYPDWRLGVVNILEKEGVHATFFITSGQFQGMPMWNERILHAIAKAPENTDSLQLKLPGFAILKFSDVHDKRETIQRLDNALKYQDPDLKEELLQILEAHTKFNPLSTPTMSIEDLRYLHAKGFGVGAHSVTHPILSRCSESKAYQEICNAKENLEALINGKISAFAYPNGTPGKDFGTEHIRMVKKAGYKYALTTLYGTARKETSLFQIPRFTPWGPTSARMNWQFTKNLMQKASMLRE